MWLKTMNTRIIRWVPFDYISNNRLILQELSHQPSFPKVDWAPLEYFDVADRGDFADPEKRALLSAAIKVTHLTPAIGTEIEGIDLRQLSGQQKDEL